MTQRERMLAGQLYTPGDEELRRDFLRAKRLTRLFNTTTEEEEARRAQLLKELLGSVGEGVYIEPPFFCDYGSHIHIGANFYANYDCIIIDVCQVHIGDNVLFGPRATVRLLT